MSQDEIAKLHKAIRELKESNDRQFDELNDTNDKRFEALNSKVDPIYKIFTNVSGFTDVSILILKGLGLIGLGVGVIYGFIKWLKA